MDVNAQDSASVNLALGVALSHVAVAVLLQVEVGVIYLLEGAFSAEQVSNYFLWLPVSQFSTLCAAALMALAVWVVARGAAGRGAAYAIALAANALLCAGQAVFLTTGLYPEPSLLADLLSSEDFVGAGISKSLPLLGLNLGFALIVTTVLPRAVSRPAAAVADAAGRSGGQILLLLVVGIQMAGAALSPYASIALHPVYATFEPAMRADGPQRSASRAVWNVHHSGLGRPAEIPPVAFSADNGGSSVFVLFSDTAQTLDVVGHSGWYFPHVYGLELPEGGASAGLRATQIAQRIAAYVPAVDRRDIIDLTGARSEAVAAALDALSTAPLLIPQRIPTELVALRDALTRRSPSTLWLVAIPSSASAPSIDTLGQTLWRDQHIALRVNVLALADRNRPPRSFNVPYSLDDLLAAHDGGETLKSKNVFFRARSAVPAWGVYDGRWKFFAGFYGNGSRLFDLQEDPFELTNLAGKHPARVDYYHRLLASRFSTLGGPQQALRANDGYVNDRPPSRTGSFGPKALSFSVAGHRGARFDGRSVPVLELSLLPYWKNVELVSQWAGPAGERFTYPMQIARRWARYRFSPSMRPPLSSGQWQVVLKQGDTALLGGDFFVDAQGENNTERDAGFRTARRVYLSASREYELVAASVFGVDELPRIDDVGGHAGEAWHSVWWPPQGAAVLAKEVYSGPRPLGVGKWRVKLIADSGQPIVELGFEVRAGAAGEN